MVGDARLDARVNFVVDEDTGKAADFQKLAAIRQPSGQVVDLDLAHFLEVDRDAPGAGFGDDPIEGDDDDTGITGFLDGAVQRCR